MNLQNKDKLFEFQPFEILVISNDEIKLSLQESMKNQNFEIISTSIREFSDCINDRTLVAIIDERKLNQFDHVDFLNSFVSKNLIPILYLGTKSRSDSFYQKLYQKGFAGALRWPDDMAQIQSIILALLKTKYDYDGKTTSDRRLSRFVKTYLRSTERIKNLKVYVENGFAFISGQTKNLFDKNFVRRLMHRVGGVENFNLEEVKIKNDSYIADKDLEREIKVFISQHLGITKKAVRVRVKNKHVFLSGTVLDSGSIVDLERFILKQIGVKSIKNEVYVNPRKTKEHTFMAKRVEERIKSLFDGVKYISVSLNDKTAEVSGTVNLFEQRKLVENYILQVLPVRKVVNKIYVSNGT